MSNNKFLSDYVYLAEASYADFSNPNNTDKKAITDAGKPEAFATLVTNHYSVVAHYKDLGNSLSTADSSFSATLFLGKAGTENAGKYVIAMKGTKEVEDLVNADAGNIVHDGLAHHQIVDMYNFWHINHHKNKSALLVA